MAVSDPTGVLATPLAAIPAPDSRRGRARLRALFSDLAVDRIVVGLPLSLSGGDSTETAETRAFAQALQHAVDVPWSSTTSGSRR